MQNISIEQFNRIDKTRLSYFTFGKAPKFYSFPASLMLFAIASGLSAIFFQAENVTLDAAIIFSAIFCLPMFSIAMVILIKFIVAVTLHSKISIAVYNSELYIKNKKEYLIFKREQLVDASVKSDTIQTREMRSHGYAPFDSDSGTIKLETLDGVFLVPCRNLEKTATALLAFIQNKDINSELKDYKPSFGNDFVKGLLRVTGIFGILLSLETSAVFVAALTGFHIASVVILAILSAATFIFAVAGILYVFIAPQLKKGRLETIDAKDEMKNFVTAKSEKTNFSEAKADVAAAEIKRKCLSYLGKIIPFFIVCFLANIGVGIGFYYGVYGLITVALFLYPFTIFVVTYIVLNLLHVRTAKRVALKGDFTVAKVIDFKLGASGLGRMTLQFSNQKNEQMIIKTPYLYDNSEVKTAAAKGSVNIKFHKKKILVLT